MFTSSAVPVLSVSADFTRVESLLRMSSTVAFSRGAFCSFNMVREMVVVD